MTTRDGSTAELHARLTAHRRVYALVLCGCAAYVLGVLLGQARIGFGALGWLLVSAGTVAIMRRESIHLESWALSRQRRQDLLAHLTQPVSRSRKIANVVTGATLIAVGSWSLNLAIVGLR